MSDARRYITGVLLTEQGGAPIADATVLVTRGTGTRKKVIGRARSDGKGRYSVRVEDDGLTASSGALSLRVEHQGKELDLGYDSQASIELSSLPLERDLWATVPIQRPRRPKGNALPTWHITGSLRHVDGSVPDDGDVSLLAMEVGIAGSDPLELEKGGRPPTRTAPTSSRSPRAWRARTSASSSRTAAARWCWVRVR